MNYGKVFSWTIIGLSFAAAIGYACAANWQRAAYWFFAGCIAVTVTL
jgi:hypothetical protein